MGKGWQSTSLTTKTMATVAGVVLTPVIMKCFVCMASTLIRTYSLRTKPQRKQYLPCSNSFFQIWKIIAPRILFIDSLIHQLHIPHTIIPQLLIETLKMPNVDTGTCNWILDFLTERRQTVSVSSNISKPQGYVLSLLLFTLLSHDCSDRLASNCDRPILCKLMKP